MERSAWVLLLALAIGWGVVGRSHSVPVADPQRPGEAASGQARRSMAREESSRPERNRTKSSSSEGAAAHANSALGMSDPLQRMAAFTALVSSADKAGLRDIQEVFAKLRAEGRRFPSEEKLLDFRAGQVDGAALLASRSESSLTGADLETVRPQFEGWLAGDPAAAARWLDSLPQGRFRDQLVLSRIATVADDPALTLELAASLHPSQQSEAGRTVARRLVETQSLDHAVATLSEMDPRGTGADATYMNSLFDSVVNDSLSAGEGKAAEVVEKLADRSFVTPSTLIKVSASMAGKDPAAAFDWVARMEQMKPDLNEGALLAATVSGVGSDNIASAEQWTAAHSNVPGASLLKQALKRRRDYLEDGSGGDNDKYDKDD